MDASLLIEKTRVDGTGEGSEIEKDPRGPTASKRLQWKYQNFTGLPEDPS